MKAHLKISKVPLKEGEDQVAFCGEIVPKAHFEFTLDGISSDSPRSTLMFCSDCLQRSLLAGGALEKHIVYGLVGGEEAMQAGRQ